MTPPLTSLAKRPVKFKTASRTLAYTLIGALTLTACGEPVLETSRAIDTTQAVAIDQEITPGSKGPQQLSGSLRQRVYSRGASTLEPAVGELILTQKADGREIRISVKADGSFELPPDLADGEYGLSARLARNGKAYQETFDAIRIQKGQPQAPLALISDVVALKGKVRLEGESGAEGVEVRLSDSALSAQSGRDGSFDLGEVPLSMLKGHSLLLQKTNFVTQSRSLGQSIDVGDLGNFLAAPELKSLVPLAEHSVLVREAGRVQISETRLPPRFVGDIEMIDQKVEGSFADGPADQAGFNRPTGLAQAPDGSLLVSDSLNHRIRRIGPDRSVSTLAGGEPGFADGEASLARFNLPQGLARDAAGNLYVADTGNHAIRKITPEGRVSTLAGGMPGNSQAGFADGDGSAARFNLPTDLDIDAAGNLYVLDFANRAIRRISPQGRVETIYRSNWNLRGIYAELFARYLKLPDYYPLLAQPLGPDTASLMVPIGLAVTPTGQVYVSDAANYLVFRIENGQASYFAGNSQSFYPNGLSSANPNLLSFDKPRSLRADAAGNLYLADALQVYRFDPQGRPTKLIGLSAKLNGFKDQARFQRENLFAPGALLPQSDGSLTLSDRYSQGIYRIYPCEQNQAAACKGEPYYARFQNQSGLWQWEMQRYDVLSPGVLGVITDPPLIPQDAPVESPDHAPPYVLTIENRSPKLRFGPGMYLMANTAREEFFSANQVDRGRGFEAFAEDGNLVALSALNLTSWEPPNQNPAAPLVFDDPTRVLMPGQTLSIFVAWGSYLHLNIRLSDSNDRFISFGPRGLPLQKADGRWQSGDVSAALGLWDAGTEVDEPLGQGQFQPDRQPYANSGPDENGVVHQINDPTLRPADQLRVTLTPLPPDTDIIAWQRQYIRAGGQELINSDYSGPRLEQP